MKSGAPIPRDQLDGLVTFVRVAELRSFRAAAEEMGVSPSAVSQAIRALEARVGAPLLMRTTRRVGLTEAGGRLLAKARPAVGDIVQAIDEARALASEVSGLLRLNAPRGMIGPVVEPLVGEFMRLHAKVDIEVTVEDAFVSIVEGGFDAGFRLGEDVDPEMISVRVTPPFRFLVYGAPDYLARYGEPVTPQDLQTHRCLRVAHSSAPVRWAFQENGTPVEIEVRGPLLTNDAALARALAADGLGLCWSAEPLAEAAVQAGRLRPVLESCALATPGVCLYYPSRAQALPKLRAFVEFARGRRLYSDAVMPPSTNTSEPLR